MRANAFAFNSADWNGGPFTYNTNELADGERFLVGSQLWEIDYNRRSRTGLATFTSDYLPNGSFVAITAVPEPVLSMHSLCENFAGLKDAPSVRVDQASDTVRRHRPEVSSRR